MVMISSLRHPFTIQIPSIQMVDYALRGFCQANGAICCGKIARGLRSREDECRHQRVGTPTHTSVDKARKLAWGSYRRIEKNRRKEKISILFMKTAGGL